MSRIGKKIIEIPAGVDVAIEGEKISVKGPKGTCAFSVHPDMKIEREGSLLKVLPKQGIDNLTKQIQALWGTTRQIIFNMIQGVQRGYEKKLEIEGVGYRAVLQGKSLVLYVGFTNPITLQIPEGIIVSIDKNVIVISGTEKEKVGQFAASIRKTRVVEPYKGKGIKYQEEQVRRKLGKRAAVTAGAAGAK